MAQKRLLAAVIAGAILAVALGYVLRNAMGFNLSLWLAENNAMPWLLGGILLAAGLLFWAKS